jgi:4-diphosphocytidyl-2-C-methyl-D-erythritol kinase
MSRPFRVHAVTPAKVNLGLEVVARRPDGLHDIVSILQSVSLYDAFEWTETHAPFEYRGIAGVAPEDDLVARALSQAVDRERWTGRLAVRKRIPAAAGLGGGSSDAALALRLALPDMKDEELRSRAEKLGSDVPFCLSAGTALVTGTGTNVTPLAASRLWFVIVTPPLAIAGKTRALYRGLETRDFSDGLSVHGIARRLRAGSIPGDMIPNAFASQLMSFPVVRYAYDRLVLAGSSVVSISGAGPAVYAVMGSYVEAYRVATLLPRDIGLINVVRSVAARDQPSVRDMSLAMRGSFERR